MTKKTIAVALYGGAIQDNNNLVQGFLEIAAKIKNQGHLLLIYTEGDKDFLNAWCLRNKFLPYTDENYDFIISPLAVGSPLNDDKDIDWAVTEIILETYGVLRSRENLNITDKLVIKEA